MGTPILLLNTKVEMQKTLGLAKTITAISKAVQAVITGTHDFAAGDLVLLDVIVGMTQLNKVVVRVLSISTTVSFVAEGLDSTNFSTYVSGGTATKIATFDTFSNVTSFNFPEPAPNKIETTTVHDTVKKQIFGLDEAPEITLALQADPMDAAVSNLRLASLAKATRVFRVTLQTGLVMIFNAYVAGGRGLDGAAGDVASASASLSLASNEQFFSS